MARINPVSKGAIAGDNSPAAVATNTAAFQACLDEQSKSFAPIDVPGRFYVGPLVATGSVFLIGENRIYSQLIFDARSSTGADRDAALFDFHTNKVSPSGMIVERIGFYSAAGQTAAKRHVGFQFSRQGNSNRHIKMVDVLGAKFSDAFIELPNSWNCSFHDMIGDRCGRPISETGWSKEGAFLRMGFQDTQPDTMVSSGNVFKNFYMNGCNHGITAQEDTPGAGWYNVVCFQRFEQIYAEVCQIGIYMPSSMDCVLSHCYFEANLEHGAVMGHARAESCRHRPNTPDDIVINRDLFPWEPAMAHHEHFATERRVRLPNETIRELWAPHYGLVAFASDGDAFNGIVRVQTLGKAACKAIAGIPTSSCLVAPPNLQTWPGKVMLLAPGDGRLWLQNRSGAEINITYHVIGVPWSDA